MQPNYGSLIIGVKLEGSEDGHPEHAMTIQAKYLINWSLIWIAEVCSQVAPVAAVLQIVILVKENALAATENSSAAYKKMIYDPA